MAREWETKIEFYVRHGENVRVAGHNKLPLLCMELNYCVKILASQIVCVCVCK